MQAEPSIADQKAYIIGIFRKIQPLSFELDSELCGYLGVMPNGRVAVTPVYRGGEGHCRLPDVPQDVRLFASFHTHGSHNTDYDSELPSSDDVLGDASDRVDGWVATPGGRLWFVNSEDLSIELICDDGCTPVDPAYNPADTRPIKSRYTLEELIARESGY